MKIRQFSGLIKVFFVHFQANLSFLSYLYHSKFLKISLEIGAIFKKICFNFIDKKFLPIKFDILLIIRIGKLLKFY